MRHQLTIERLFWGQQPSSNFQNILWKRLKQIVLIKLKEIFPRNNKINVTQIHQHFFPIYDYLKIDLLIGWNDLMCFAEICWLQLSCQRMSLCHISHLSQIPDFPPQIRLISQNCGKQKGYIKIHSINIGICTIC